MKNWLNGLGISAERLNPPARVRLNFVGDVQEFDDGFGRDRAFAAKSADTKHGGNS
jgi:hypothetical protein